MHCGRGSSIQSGEAVAVWRKIKQPSHDSRSDLDHSFCVRWHVRGKYSEPSEPFWGLCAAADFPAIFVIFVILIFVMKHNGQIQMQNHEEKNSITDTYSTADCCPLLAVCPRCCPTHAPDDAVPGCTWLYLTVPGCTWLYLALSWSAMIYLSTDWH